MTSKMIFYLLIICTIVSLIFGIFTGNWNGMEYVANTMIFILLPTYLSLFRKWYTLLATPFIMLSIERFIKRYELYSQSIISDFLLDTFVELAFWFLAGAIILLSFSIKSYLKSKKSIYYINDPEYNNFSEYYTKEMVAELRACVKKGWDEFLNNDR
ncbi:hypothetical protein [Cloacibacillus evryensis]|uniref:hypothetical protein n=1 Tax=Cloacibacillus evryensis TaxID=508460 RepID=UPI002109CF61|nr:hypothetical protein [Cloacibacillus evryensis]MCQ4763465.1 hypothetical protein [Cloacibacillus evryensis]